MQREREGIDRNGQDINHQITNHFPLPSENEYNCLQAIDRSQENQRSVWNNLGTRGQEINNVPKIYDHDWLQDCADQVKHDNESHTETAETT